MDWTWYFFRFDGRINRALLWQALLIVVLLAGLLDVIGQVIRSLEAGTSIALKLGLDINFDFSTDGLFKAIDPRAYRLLPTADRPTLILKVLGTSLFFWILLATTIKRLHDRDRSGWWLVPLFFVPRLLLHFNELLPDASWFVPFDLAIDALWLWGFVELFIAPGTSGDNRFGPDPLAKDEDRPAAPPAQSWDQQREIDFVPPSASPPGGMHVKRSA
ncbi:DUF805 domain-containing protein [Bradyrhizobium sp. B117]|uniref:DUF805 domain-containing protein n=1 Tax=Bradyrhizobium sp. B117 TaxID=3140246 RepID=UPI0031830D08